MRITMVLDAGHDFPPDIRVEKEARALSDAGHDLRIFSQRYADGVQASEFIPALGATVFRAAIQNPAGHKIANAVRSMAMYDWRWRHPLVSHLVAHPTDVLHVHDLPLVPVVLDVAERFGIPVVADLHENMPAAMLAIRSDHPPLRWLAEAIVWNYSLMQFLERRALRRCARVVVVVPEAAERLRKYGIPSDRIVVVSNTEDESTFHFDPKSADPAIVARYKGRVVASYVGSVGVHRGLDTVVEAVPAILREVPHFLLLVVGADCRSRRAIEARARELGVAEAVSTLGWQPFHMVNSYMMASDVCLVPHNDFEHTQTTIPHKLFQYMISGKPVLVSDCRPLARVVHASGAGKVFTAGSSASFACEMIWMATHPEVRAAMGLRGREAARTTFSWSRDALSLQSMYAALARVEPSSLGG